MAEEQLVLTAVGRWPPTIRCTRVQLQAQRSACRGRTPDTLSMMTRHQNYTVKLRISRARFGGPRPDLPIMEPYPLLPSHHHPIQLTVGDLTPEKILKLQNARRPRSVLEYLETTLSCIFRMNCNFYPHKLIVESHISQKKLQNYFINELLKSRLTLLQLLPYYSKMVLILG